MSVPAWVAQAVTQISTFKGLATHPFARYLPHCKTSSAPSMVAVLGYGL
ncbi:hypothetical protein ACVK1X_002678 [Pseudomonas sp. PvR086]|jgi:hypothetical protein|nr:hypothetical protein [Pseudomonas frederiksbergensis]